VTLGLAIVAPQTEPISISFPETFSLFGDFSRMFSIGNQAGAIFRQGGCRLTHAFTVEVSAPALIEEVRSAITAGRDSVTSLRRGAVSKTEMASGLPPSLKRVVVGPNFASLNLRDNLAGRHARQTRRAPNRP
jgi:hypothetical protein